MKKMFKRYLSVFLVVLMIITIIPMGVYAAETEEIEPIQVSEIEESRDLYSKTYETSEGTNVVISAAVPLHYEEDGELIDIDNTLVKSDKDSSILTNASNAYNVELPKKYTDDSEIKVDYEGNSISFKLLNDVKSSKGDIDSADEVDVDETDAESVAYAESNMDKLSSEITYANLLPDTDFEYNVQPNALKENIIINNVPDENYTIQYELNTGNLTALLNDDNSISLVDSENNKVFIIESPYMIDSDGDISDDITVTLEKSENGYVLTYTPDYSWLLSEDTVYPVTIDPTITINSKENGIENIEDTYTTSSSRNVKNNFNSTSVSISNDNGVENWGCYLIKSLPAISNNTKLINATLNLYSKIDSTSGLNIAAYNVSDDTNISSLNNITRNSGLSLKDSAIDIETAPLICGLMQLDITTSVNKWYADNTLSKIIVLKALENSSIELYSNNSNSNIPFITFEYAEVNGINSLYNYHTQDNGLAGVAYINDYTGELIVERDEISSNGTADDVVFYIGNNVNTPEDNYFGENTSINYFKTVDIDNSDANRTKYILTNGDGSIEKIENNVDGYVVEPKKNSSTDEIESITISKIDDNLITSECFETGKTELVNGNFVLTSVSTKMRIDDEETGNKDAKEPHTTHIYYEGGRLKKIYDETITFNFSYSKGILYCIDYYSEESNENLNEIIDYTLSDQYISSIRNEYTFDQNSTYITLGKNDQNYSPSLISYVNTENKYIIKNEFNASYEYTFNDAGQVIKVQEFNSEGKAGDYLTFEYSINSTIISDGTNTYTEYFDNNGNLLSTIEQNGNAIFNNYDNGLITQSSKIRNSSNYIADFYGFESSKDSFISLNNSTKTLDDTVKFNGEKSLKLTAQANKRAIFDGKISGLDKDTTYTVSMWVKNSNDAITDFTLTNDSGITENFVPCDNVGDWYQYCCTLDTEDATSLEIRLEINNTSINSSSVIYLDNAYVQKSTTVAPINCIENGEFTNDLEPWITGPNASVIKNNETIATADSNCLKLTGIYNDTNTISQTVSLSNVKENDKYVFGAWVKAVNALPAKEGTNREFTLSIYPIVSGTTVAEPLESISYSTDNSYWQYIEEELILNSDSVNNLNNLSGLEIRISYNYQTGYALVDGVSLLKDNLYNITFEYDDDETIEDILVDGESVLSEDNNDGNMAEVLSEEETETDSTNTPTITYDYDEYGNLVKTVSSAKINGVTESLLSKYAYGNNGSLQISSLNGLGYNTTYGYDYFGNVAAISDANQMFDEYGNIINYNTTFYQYDNFQNLSSIVNAFEQYPAIEDDNEIAVLNVKYTYTGSRLDKIETINFDETDNSENEDSIETCSNSIYSFEYDSWGNLIKIFIEKVDSTDDSNSLPYIQYEYDSSNYHQLNSISYINGQKIQYTYDKNGNIIHQKDSNNSGEDSLEYSYFYLDDGSCYAKKDLNLGTTETYSNNTITLRDSNGNVIHSYSYDSKGNTIEQIGNNEIKTYTSNEDTGTNYVTNINGSKNVLFSKYDNLGRISEEHFSSGNDKSYISREYTYYKGSAATDENTSYYDIIRGAQETYGESDPEFNSSELPRYITYYYVNSEGMKTKLYEYRYIYLPNEEIYTYTLVSGGDDAIPGESNNEELQQVRAFQYNSSNMVTTDINLDAVKIASNTPNETTSSASTASTVSTYSFWDVVLDFIAAAGKGIGQFLGEITTEIFYDSNGNILVNGNRSNGGIYYTYDEATSDSNISNCLTGIHINENDDISISYDKSGNVNKVDVSNSPTFNYNGIIDSANLNWSRGNTLDSIYLKSKSFMGASANIKVLDYKYDDNNLRTHKTIDLGSQLSYLFGTQAIANAEIDYIWNGDKLVGENIDCSGSIFNEFSGDDQINEAGKFNIVILYDNNGNAYGLVVNKTEDAYGTEVNISDTYYYLKDADNTITGLLDSEGNRVVSYSYDTFGTAIADHAEGYKYLMLINPLAYKDYIYDYETGMYYLQSRYYAPFTGRFISADNLLDTGTGTAMCTNLYAYCENDPINKVDPDGRISIYSKSSYKRIDDRFTISLTDWVSTSGNPTITWTKNTSVSAAVSGSITGSAKVIALSLGLSGSITLSASSSYSWTVDSKKGKYAKIVAKLDAARYSVTQRVVTIIGCFWFIGSPKYGYIYIPIRSSLSVELRYSDKKY